MRWVFCTLYLLVQADLLREMSAGLFDEAPTKSEGGGNDVESDEAEFDAKTNTALPRSLTRKKRNPKARLNEKLSTRSVRSEWLLVQDKRVTHSNE